MSVKKKKKINVRKKSKKKGNDFERFRFVTAWPRLRTGRAGISLYCVASSGCGALIGKVEKLGEKQE